MDKMYNKNGFVRNLNYIKTHFFMLFKIIAEYKINMYMAIINNSTAILSQGLLLTILYAKFNDLIGWQFHEYVFFILIYSFMMRFSGTFWFGTRLEQQINNGILNNYITKPINIFTQYILSTIPIQAFLVSFFYLFGLIIYIYYYFKILSIYRLLLLIPFLIFAMVFTISISRFFDSLAFFIRKNNFLFKTYNSMRSFYRNYPVIMFDNYIKTIGYFFGIVYFGAYATQFMFFKIHYYEFYILHLIILLLSFIFIILTFLLWHYGLKKYESFGYNPIDTFIYNKM